MCKGDGAESDGCQVPAPVTSCALVDSVKQHERYGQLTLVNSTAADTGEFSCWGQLCTGYVCRRDEAKTGSTYIFFTGKRLAALAELSRLLDLPILKVPSVC